MAECLQLNFFLVSGDSVERDSGKDTELTTTDLLDDLGQYTYLFWASGSWFAVRLNSYLRVSNSPMEYPCFFL